MSEKKEDKGKKNVPLKYLIISIILLVFVAVAAAVSITAMFVLFIKPAANKTPWWIALYAGAICLNVSGILFFVNDKKIKKLKEQKKENIGQADADGSTETEDK